jgi:DNA-directed RNA polymerase specialized sigma24 family protein
LLPADLILRNATDAKDVLMDTLLTALDRGSSLRDPAAMRPWLLKNRSSRFETRS